MVEIFPLLIVFALYFPAPSVQADKSYPDFYNVDYANSDFPNLKGFYRKEDYTHQGKPVYKKPRVENYLYLNEDGKWTVGAKWTRDTNLGRITMDYEGKDSPESGEWGGLISGRGDEHDIDVSVTKYTQEYPDYYQVNSSSNLLEGYYEKLPESQNYLKFPVFRKKGHGNGNETLFLYLHLEGDWRIGRTANNDSSDGFASSYSKGLPDPYLSKGWKVWEGSWKADYKFKVTPLNPFYPSVYTIEYHGSDETMMEKVKTLNVLGNYTNRQDDHHGAPQYENRQTSMNLFRCTNGRWVIAYHVSTSCDSTIYQESNGSPTPLERMTWKLTKVDHLLLDLSLTAGKPPMIPRNPSMNDEADDDNANQQDETIIGMVLGIVLGAIFVLITVAITAFFIGKKCRKEEEVASIDVNTDYKHYQDYDEDNVVIDNNDYYEANNVDTEYYTYA